MSKVAVVTDSNSGITQEKAEELGIYVLPMPFMIDGIEYFEGINLTTDEFFRQLEAEKTITTSQPTPESVTGLWKKLLEEYDEVVHIPMSSGLSGSCQTAYMLAQEFDGKVQVVNNQRISFTLEQSVNDALTLIDQGKNAQEIKDILEQQKFEATIYIMLDTLTYLKRGGRITPAAAALGNLLKLKPVLQIQGEKLDAFAKARTVKQAKTIMKDAIMDDIQNRFNGNQNDDVEICVVHTQNLEAAEDFRKEIMEIYPNINVKITTLSLSVSCHIGPGSLAIACCKKVK